MSRLTAVHHIFILITMPNTSDIHHRLFQPVSSNDIREVFGPSVKTQSVPPNVLRQVKHYASSEDWAKIVHLAGLKRFCKIVFASLTSSLFLLLSFYFL